MGKGLVVLIAVLILCGPADADLRLFFDKTPTVDRGDLTQLAGVLAFEDPVVQPDERLYIYFEFHEAGLQWFAVNFNVTAEDGLITRAHMFNGIGQVVNPLERGVAEPARHAGRADRAVQCRGNNPQSNRVAAPGGSRYCAIAWVGKRPSS